MRLYAAAIQLALNQKRGCRFAGAGRPGQQNDGTLRGVGGDQIGCAVDLVMIKAPVVLQYGCRVGSQKGRELVGGHVQDSFLL